MKKLLLLPVTLLFSIAVFAFNSTPPMPLRKLVAESEYIIEGKVLYLSIDARSHTNSQVEQYAMVLVKKSLKGKALTDTIKIMYSAYMICPAGPNFIKNDEIIAFLQKDKKTNAYHVPGLIHGVKYSLGKEGIFVYEKRIIEMMGILTIMNTLERRQKTIDWLLTCAENKFTSWEGVQELYPGRDFIPLDKKGKSSQKQILNKTQKERLSAIVLEADTLNYLHMPFVNSVFGVNDARLLTMLKTSLARVDAEHLWPGEFIMEKIARLTADKELEKLSNQFSGYSSFDQTKRAIRKKLYEEFMRKMKNAELPNS